MESRGRLLKLGLWTGVIFVGVGLAACTKKSTDSVSSEPALAPGLSDGVKKDIPPSPNAPNTLSGINNGAPGTDTTLPVPRADLQPSLNAPATPAIVETHPKHVKRVRRHVRHGKHSSRLAARPRRHHKRRHH